MNATAQKAPIATTGDLAGLLGADLDGPGDLPLFGVAGIDDAAEGDLTFVRSSKYAGRWSASAASAAVVTRGLEIPGHDAASRALLFVDDADRAMLALLEAAAARAPRPAPEPGVHPTALIGEGATVPASATVGEFAVIGAGSVLGEKTVVGAFCSIAPGTRIGDGTVLHPRVTIAPQTTIGRGSEIFSGVVIGTDGFGFLPGPEGPVKEPHLGGVTIGDRVEIGANTTVDRGKFGDTSIGDLTKIDNLCQIGHSCRVGRGVVICGCCALSGSVVVGDGSLLGGRVSVRDNVTLAPGSQIGGCSVVHCDVTADEPWWGWPARPVSTSRRIAGVTQKLPKLWETVRELSRRVRELERGAGS